MLAALGDDPLPFEHRALDVLWQKMVSIFIHYILSVLNVGAQVTPPFMYVFIYHPCPL
jgi:hypothetical protein